MIVLIDNYDSFTYNLRRYLVQLEQRVEVLRNDAPTLESTVASSDCRAVIVSPGPRRPSDAGKCLEIVSSQSGIRPILGVCLGHQVIVEAFGGRIVRAKRPIHGQSLPVDLDESRLFQNLPTRDYFARYHSLVAKSNCIPDTLHVTARSLEGEVMAVEHRSHPTFGVQFHPESVLSTSGYQILSNFLNIAGLERSAELPPNDCNFESSLHSAGAPEDEREHAVVLPERPMT